MASSSVLFNAQTPPVTPKITGKWSSKKEFSRNMIPTLLRRFATDDEVARMVTYTGSALASATNAPPTASVAAW